MKTLSLIVSLFLISCTTDSLVDNAIDKKLILEYNYKSDEIKLDELICEYRVSIGLNPLGLINHISNKCEEHNNYMIANNVVNHSYFQERSDNIRSVLGTSNVSEIVAYNYIQPQGVLDAWLKSPSHKEAIEGNFTDFGVSITKSPEGKNYFTVIFIKR
ncbi:CAP_bacterial domain containing protein [Flavobacteriaceae bacterium]